MPGNRGGDECGSRPQPARIGTWLDLQCLFCLSVVLEIVVQDSCDILAVEHSILNVRVPFSADEGICLPIVLQGSLELPLVLIVPAEIVVGACFHLVGGFPVSAASYKSYSGLIDLSWWSI
jgi:hypothetical protein